MTRLIIQTRQAALQPSANLADYLELRQLAGAQQWRDRVNVYDVRATVAASIYSTDSTVYQVGRLVAQL